MKEENVRIELASADVRGEIIDVYTDGKKVRIVHTFPGYRRGGYIFPDTEKRAMILDGSVTFHLVKPENPEDEKVRSLLIGDRITIPKGTAYRENTRKGTWFAGISIGDEKWKVYEPYRNKVVKSFEK
jgi:hypothetical protein